MDRPTSNRNNFHALFSVVNAQVSLQASLGSMNSTDTSKLHIVKRWAVSKTIRPSMRKMSSGGFLTVLADELAHKLELFPYVSARSSALRELQLLTEVSYACEGVHFGR